MQILVLFGLFLLLVMLRIPIGYSIGMSTLVTLVLYTKLPAHFVVQNSVTGVDSFPLMAIPFFILAGNLMSKGGIAKRLIKFANLLVGFVTGGLGMVTVVTSMFFAAISGSAVATTSAIGSFMIPEMEERGYDKGFSAALAAAAGTIGVIIPPSIPLVVYAVVAGESVGDLFIAGFLPGILMGIALIVTCYIISKKRNYQGTGHIPTVREIWESFKEAFWALLAPVIVLGGIYGGIFTPTEAAVVSVVYCFVISVFIYKELDRKGLYDALYDTIVVNGVTTFMVGLSTAFSAYLSIQQIPTQLANALIGITANKYVMFLMINVFLLFVGTLIDNVPATIILTPILLPVVTELGMSPLTFGVMITMNLAIGFVTPPYGINLFVASATANISIERIMKNILWFILALVVVLAITTYIPFTTIGPVQLLSK